MKKIVLIVSLLVIGIIPSQRVLAAPNNMHITDIPAYSELRIESYLDTSTGLCIRELRKADIIINEFEVLGIKYHNEGDGATLIVATCVVNNSGIDEYYVMSCKINNDMSGHIAGPVKIPKDQSYFTRDYHTGLPHEPTLGLALTDNF